MVFNGSDSDFGWLLMVWICLDSVFLVVLDSLDGFLTGWIILDRVYLVLNQLGTFFGDGKTLLLMELSAKKLGLHRRGLVTYRALGPAVWASMRSLVRGTIRFSVSSLDAQILLKAIVFLGV